MSWKHTRGGDHSVVDISNVVTDHPQGPKEVDDVREHVCREALLPTFGTRYRHVSSLIMHVCFCLHVAAGDVPGDFGHV